MTLPLKCLTDDKSLWHKHSNIQTGIWTTAKEKPPQLQELFYRINNKNIAIMILILTYHLEKVGIYKRGCYELFLVWTLPKVQYIRFNFHPIYSPNAGVEMVEAFLRKSFGENWEVPVRDQISWIIRGGSCTFPKDAQMLWT